MSFLHHLNMGFMQISCSRFKQSKNSMRKTIGCFVNCLMIFGYI